MIEFNFSFDTCNRDDLKFIGNVSRNDRDISGCVHKIFLKSQENVDMVGWYETIV